MKKSIKFLIFVLFVASHSNIFCMQPYFEYDAKNDIDTRELPPLPKTQKISIFFKNLFNKKNIKNPQITAINKPIKFIIEEETQPPTQPVSLTQQNLDAIKQKLDQAINTGDIDKIIDILNEYNIDNFDKEEIEAIISKIWKNLWLHELLLEELVTYTHVASFKKIKNELTKRLLLQEKLDLILKSQDIYKRMPDNIFSRVNASGILLDDSDSEINIENIDKIIDLQEL